MVIVRTALPILPEPVKMLGEDTLNLDQGAPEPVDEFRSARQRT
jgi:hypothetical protein